MNGAVRQQTGFLQVRCRVIPPTSGGCNRQVHVSQRRYQPGRVSPLVTVGTEMKGPHSGEASHQALRAPKSEWLGRGKLLASEGISADHVR